ncbi:MAG TPA: DUF5107 domain-containing protein [Micromonosporaceae bacterium]|nr:DUF5107 domain-containing protein [Micromonosporaceae bacterium]HCU52099.1 DUF5107 domain-containing protein [Micromonosporaceae bacterium]
MKISLNELSMPVAPLGPESPLPPLAGPGLVTIPVDLSAADPQMARNLAYGRPATLLPYTVQDGYSRNLVDTRVRTAVVENEILRAEFLLDYGGRMWSLRHKPSGRELLHRNPILQPANLALRNAWFAGGVEWNLGTTGHTPMTCAPLHAARVMRPDGVPMLRLWEFERMRELVYQLDIYAPAGSPVLVVHVSITNPNEHEVPIYWWSNIAVPSRDRTRVLAPASEAWHLASDGILRRVPAPEGYETEFEHAADYFYDIVSPFDERPWIAAVDESGAGLVQTSTSRLRGRKLFVWGKHTGGQRWQEWLSPPGHSYLEIQAGLARTQLEHLPMPAGERWTWLETYGLLETTPAVAHGEYELACAHIEESLSPMPDFDLAWVDLPPTERLHRGSGWGALEHRFRSAAGGGITPKLLIENDAPTSFSMSIPTPHMPGTPFDDDTLGRDQVSWLTLLEAGTMPAPAPRLAPSSYQVSPRWRQLLEQASPQNWFTLLHLGVARWHAADRDAAVEAWHQSHGASPNPWALRNLAFAGDDQVERLRTAHAMVPGVRAIAVETIQAMLAAGKPAEALGFIDRLVLNLRSNGRIRLLECRAAIDAGRLDRAARIVDTGIVVDDLREGEDALDDLWFRYHTQRGSTPVPQLPCLYDFRTGAPQ